MAPYVSVGLAGLRVRICLFVIREALPVGHNFLPAPVPVGTGLCPYPRPAGRVPAGTRIFCARCHLCLQPTSNSNWAAAGPPDGWRLTAAGSRQQEGGAAFPRACLSWCSSVRSRCCGVLRSSGVLFLGVSCYAFVTCLVVKFFLDFATVALLFLFVL